MAARGGGGFEEGGGEKEEGEVEGCLGGVFEGVGGDEVG